MLAPPTGARAGNDGLDSRQDGAGLEPDNELDFRLLTGDLAGVERTLTFRTMGAFVRPGRPGASPLIRAVSTRDFFERMPPLASERTNSAAVALLRRWIEVL